MSFHDRIPIVELDSPIEESWSGRLQPLVLLASQTPILTCATSTTSPLSEQQHNLLQSQLAKSSPPRPGSPLYKPSPPPFPPSETHVTKRVPTTAPTEPRYIQPPTASYVGLPQAPSTEYPIYAPAPKRILTFTTPVAPRLLQSAPVSERAYEGTDRGWSTAPSILEGLPGHPPSPPSHPHNFREPHAPLRWKRAQECSSRPGLQRLDIAEQYPPIYRWDDSDHHMKRMQEDGVSPEITSTSSKSVYTTKDVYHRAISPDQITRPPLVDSIDDVLDRFVVESARAYASAMQVPGSCNDDPSVNDLTYNLCSVFMDLQRYQNVLEYRDERAQNIIDALQAVLDCANIEKQFKVILVVALSRIARKAELYPQCFILHNVIRLQKTFAEGHFGEIEKGYFAGQVVGIKIPKLTTLENSDKRLLRRALSREIIPWAQMSHENLLPFYGIIELGDACELGIVSPFLKNGNIVDYLRRNPGADMPSFVFGIAAGMAHLHDNGLVHGDIKGSNILVSDTVPPRACLADFGFTTVTDSDGLRSTRLSSGPVEGGTMQFEAPELLNPKSTYRRTAASDVYAFAMACYEIFTGKSPFAGKRDAHVIAMVTTGKRPSRPAGRVYEDRGLTVLIWALMENSWQDHPDSRPTARDITEYLLQHSVIDPRSIGQGWGNLSPLQFRNS
ncbi:hypothetical protein DXG01_001974 [Tephrocybe rancida]|nr:hypothetical protein DXG01_001974 [Tephrocybe rancida]